MTQYALCFVKGTKVVHTEYFNSGTNSLFETSVWFLHRADMVSRLPPNEFKRWFKRYKKSLGFDPDKINGIRQYMITDDFFQPLAKIYTSDECYIRIFPRDKWVPIKLTYLPFHFDVDKEESETIDCKEDFDYIIYMSNDCGESDDEVFMSHLCSIATTLTKLRDLTKCVEESGLNVP